MIGHVIREFLPCAAPAHLSRRDPARLQPLRPPRQHLQGAHQDPGQGARRRRSSRARSKPNGRTCTDGPATRARRGNRARSTSRFTPPRVRALARRRRRVSRGARRQPRVRALGASATSIRTSVPGYAVVTLSLKKTGVPPGDVTADQMDALADLADRYSFGELRVSHEQNLIFADVRQARPARRCGASCSALGLATPNIGLLTNIIAARAATSARSPTPSRSRSPRRSSAASTTSTTCTTSASSTSTSPAA